MKSQTTIKITKLHSPTNISIISPPTSIAKMSRKISTDYYIENTSYTVRRRVQRNTNFYYYRYSLRYVSLVFRSRSIFSSLLLYQENFCARQEMFRFYFTFYYIHITLDRTLYHDFIVKT